MDEAIIKNNEYEVTVEGYSSEGMGVCRINGRAVFVPGTIRGERWKIRILKVTNTAVYGKCIECLSSSTERIETDCIYYPKCGGCTLRHMSYNEELRFKLEKVNSSIQRIGKQNFSVDEIIGAESVLRYRNKVIFNTAGETENVCYGFFRERSHELIAVDDCLIQPEISSRCASAVCGFMNLNGFAAYNEETGKGYLRHIFVRKSLYTDDVVLCLSSAKGFGDKTEALVSYICSLCPEITGIVININRERYNTIISGSFYTLFGSPLMHDSLCSNSFEISPEAFYQVNPRQAEKLYDIAVDYASGSNNILELYCGAGTISLCLAKVCSEVTSAEIIPEAVENAKKNAEKNGISNVNFICADAAKAAHDYAGRFDCVLVDPPRKGMSEETIINIAKINPDRIVYVSCNPSTLARDILRLNDFGYYPEKGKAVDMFPRTSHVETVVLLSKGEVDSKKIRVEFSLEDMDMSEFQDGATYTQIKDYVLEHSGLKVSNLYISQIKRKCGIEVGKNYNLPKSEDSRQPLCPPEKEKAIREAFKYFGII